MAFGPLPSPAGLDTNPIWKHPASEWAACLAEGGITMGVVLGYRQEMGDDYVLELLSSLVT